MSTNDGYLPFLEEIPVETVVIKNLSIVLERRHSIKKRPTISQVERFFCHHIYIEINVKMASPPCVRIIFLSLVILPYRATRMI